MRHCETSHHGPSSIFEYCKAQTSSIWRLRAAWPGGFILKLIKEDHFACTTKMSEFFKVHSGACVSRSWNKPGSRPDRSSTPDPLDTHPRGHPTIHLSKSTLTMMPQTLTCRRRRDFHLTSVRREGDNIVATQSVNWCRENFNPVSNLLLVLRKKQRAVSIRFMPQLSTATKSTPKVCPTRADYAEHSPTRQGPFPF